MVYGDTDSIMVNTGIKSANTKESIGQAISFAHQVFKNYILPCGGEGSSRKGLKYTAKFENAILKNVQFTSIF